MDDTDVKTPLLDGAVPTTAVKQPAINKRLYVIIPIIGLYFYSIGIDMFTATEYTQDVMQKRYFPEKRGNETFPVCNGDKNGSDYHLHQKVQQKTAEWSVYYNLAMYIPATITSLLLGPLTDRFGRKFFLALSIFGYVVRLATITVVARYDLSLLYIVGASFIFGVCGSIYAIFAVSFSIISDVTVSGSKRTVVIVAVELFVGVVVGVSAFVTGFYVQSSGYFPSYLLATCLAFTSFLLVVFVLPESLKSRDLNQTLSITKSAKRCFHFYFNTENKIVRKQYILLILAFVFFSMTMLNKSQMDTLYELGSPFCWSRSKVGWFGTARITAGVIASFLILLPLRRCLAEDTIALLTNFTAVASLIIEAFATTDILLYIMAVVGLPGMIPIPLIRSMMSQLTPQEQQGALFSSIGVVETLCSLLGSLTSNIVYSATLSIMNGFVFLVIAALASVSIGIFGVLIYIRRKHPDHTRLNP